MNSSAPMNICALLASYRSATRLCITSCLCGNALLTQIKWNHHTLQRISWVWRNSRFCLYGYCDGVVAKWKSCPLHMYISSSPTSTQIQMHTSSVRTNTQSSQEAKLRTGHGISSLRQSVLVIESTLTKCKCWCSRSRSIKYRKAYTHKFHLTWPIGTDYFSSGFALCVIVSLINAWWMELDGEVFRPEIVLDKTRPSHMPGWFNSVACGRLSRKLLE